jgi:hypothetical protein
MMLEKYLCRSMALKESSVSDNGEWLLVKTDSIKIHDDNNGGKMKKFLIMFSLLTLVSCGKSGNGGGLPPVSNNPEEPVDQFVVVSRATICMSSDSSCNSLNALYRTLNFMSPIQMAYAATSGSTNFSYTVSAVGTASFPAPPDLASPVLDNPTGPLQANFGTLSIPTYDINQLNVCTSPTKCTKAKVRAYVSSISSGGAFVRIGSSPTLEGNASLELATTQATSVDIVSPVTIPANRNRIRNSPAGQDPFSGSLSDMGDLILDLTNASAGSYSATVQIELVIGH